MSPRLLLPADQHLHLGIAVAALLAYLVAIAT